MPNRENNVSRAGNTSKHVGKLGNIVSVTKMFLNSLGKQLDNEAELSNCFSIHS